LDGLTKVQIKYIQKKYKKYFMDGGYKLYV